MRRIRAAALCGVLLTACAFGARAGDADVQAGKTSVARAAAARCAKSQDPSEDKDMRSARLITCLTWELAFNPDLYFRGDLADDRNEPGGIVDAVYSGALDGPHWAFAIDHACPGEVGFPSACRFEQEKLLIRVVSIKTAAISPRPPGPMAPTLEAVRTESDRVLAWRVADVRVCPGAEKALLALEHVQWFAFADDDRSYITRGKLPGELVAVADGENITVRARGFYSTYAADEFKDSGAISGWAEKMRKVVEPCLKPETAPAPWDRD
ncbi:MAG TPA: hypothetical protein VGG29_02060 [Caulobacteraceae bacterium]|jgi:hypothetical protein